MAFNKSTIEYFTMSNNLLQSEKRSYFMECKKSCNNYSEIIQKEISEYIPIFEVISNNNIIITKIIHLADIHIKLNSCHKEYSFVFDELYKKLREIKEKSIICICGDLLHTKNKLEPNIIIYTWDFLKTLSLIFPLFIIPGNHDVIEVNNNKIDSITAILEGRNLDNIFYLSSSGVYIYNNIIFGVSSIIDQYLLTREQLESILNKNNISIEQKIIVALYHGYVYSNLDISSNISDKGILLEAFKGKALKNYDYILLGDTHKFKYLNIEKTAAYASSLISQNFNECDIYHGYLEWNILTSESNYNILNNEYAYHKIDYDELINTEEFIKLLPSTTGYLRIDIKEDLLYKINKESFALEINNKYPRLIISWKIIINKNKYIADQAQLNNIIINFIKTKYYNISDKKIHEVIKELNIITNKFQNEITNNANNIQSLDWTLVWLSFDNLYAYGENNIVDFTQYSDNEIIGIFGDNAVGKSSLIDIITYMLYGRNARDTTPINHKDIVNVNCSKANGTLVIKVNTDNYVIIRNLTRNFSKQYNKVNITCKLEFYKLKEYETFSSLPERRARFHFNNKGYELISLIEENKNNTQQIINSLVGVYDNFITTSLLLQNNVKSFKTKSKNEKKEFLCDILNINYFKPCDNYVSDELKNLTIKYNIYQKLSIKYNKYNLKDLENNIKYYDDEIKYLSKYLDILRIEQKTIKEYNCYFNNLVKLDEHNIEEYISLIKENNFILQTSLDKNIKLLDKYKIRCNINKIIKVSKLIGRYSFLIKNNNNNLQNIITFSSNNHTKQNNSSEITTIKKTIQNYTIQKNKLSIIYNKIINNNTELNNINSKLFIYDVLSKITCRNGIQTQILHNSLNIINIHLNIIINPFMNKIIKFKLNDDALDIMICNNDIISDENTKLSSSENSASNIYTLSGMELFIVDIALKIVIRNITNLPKSNMLFLDESLSVLDSSKLNKLDEFFMFLRSNFKRVFLISHMLSEIDNINNNAKLVNAYINIFKSNEYSFVKNI